MRKIWLRALLAALFGPLAMVMEAEAQAPTGGSTVAPEKSDSTTQAGTTDPNGLPDTAPTMQDPPPNSTPVAATPAAPPADIETSKPLPFDIHGTIDVYGMGNFNNPSTGINGLRVFDTNNAGGIQLNLAKLSIEMAPSPVGFRLDIGAGLAINGPSGMGVADPSNRLHPTHAAWHRQLQQAYVSFKIPVGRGLRIDAGKFVTHMGYEVIETRDNMNYSRSLLFGYAIPFFHTGLRALYALSDNTNLGVYWLNGWNTFVHEGSQMMTGGLSLAHNTEQGTLAFNYIGGRTALDSSQRHVFDLIGVYNATDKLKLALNFDVGHDTAGGGATYWGVAAYGRYQWCNYFAQALRFEFFHDMDKVFLATAGLEKAWEITLTIAEMAQKIGNADMLLRVEYRHDQGNVALFATDSAMLSTHQDTVTVGTVAYF